VGDHAPDFPFEIQAAKTSAAPAEGWEATTHNLNILCFARFQTSWKSLAEK